MKQKWAMLIGCLCLSLVANAGVESKIVSEILIGNGAKAVEMRSGTIFLTIPTRAGLRCYRLPEGMTLREAIPNAGLKAVEKPFYAVPTNAIEVPLSVLPPNFVKEELSRTSAITSAGPKLMASIPPLQALVSSSLSSSVARAMNNALPKEILPNYVSTQLAKDAVAATWKDIDFLDAVGTADRLSVMFTLKSGYFTPYEEDRVYANYRDVFNNGLRVAEETKRELEKLATGEITITPAAAEVQLGHILETQAIVRTFAVEHFNSSLATDTTYLLKLDSVLGRLREAYIRLMGEEPAVTASPKEPRGRKEIERTLQKWKSNSWNWKMLMDNAPIINTKHVHRD